MSSANLWPNSCHQLSLYHNDVTTVDFSVIRNRVWRDLQWASNFVDNDFSLLELITMQVYVQPRVVRTPAYFLDRIPDSDPHDSDVSNEIQPYPYVSDVNAARLEIKTMSPVPRRPEDTIVARSGKQLRPVLFDGGSPSPNVSRAVHIAHEKSSRPWKNQLKFHKLYRIRNVSLPPSDPALAPPFSTKDTNQPASGPHGDQVPRHKYFHSSSQRNYVHRSTCASENDPRFRCCHF